ncbi:MAG: helix-turn-helix domain-containing protein, partial [Pseudonocardiales bacterium]|nr:helix-turn-helix domain-containing protein [Pseudonocardiales bacterium]
MIFLWSHPWPPWAADAGCCRLTAHSLGVGSDSDPEEFAGVSHNRGRRGRVRGRIEPLTIGERVAFYRRRCGQSQEVLAGLVGRTEDWLSRVENNRIELDRLSVIRRLADALDVSVGKLVAEPTVLDWTADSGTRTVPALRSVLMDYHQVAPLPVGALGESNREPLSLDALQRDIGQVFDAYQASRYGYVTSRVPLVLSDILHAAQAADDDDRPRAKGLLALAYQAAVAVLTKLGETDLAWVASERGLAAALQAENPVVLGSLFRSVTHALHATGRFRDGVELTEAAAGVLQPYLNGRADDALLSVYGSLFLTGAVAASRAGDRQTTAAFPGLDRALFTIRVYVDPFLDRLAADPSLRPRLRAL